MKCICLRKFCYILEQSLSTLYYTCKSVRTYDILILNYILQNKMYISKKHFAIFLTQK